MDRMEPASEEWGIQLRIVHSLTCQQSHTDGQYVWHPLLEEGSETWMCHALEQMAQKAAAYTTALASELNGSPADSS